MVAPSGGGVQAPVLLMNPRAGRLARRTSRAALRAEARRQGIEVVLPESELDLGRAVRQAVAEGRPRVLVAGGDGTLHQAIQVLAGSASALGVVPAGRGNDLARVLGVPLDPLEALALALAGPVRRIDLGRAGDRFFAGVGGVGLDGEVAAAAREGSGWLPVGLVYPWALLRTLPAFVPPRLRIEHAGGVWEGRAMLALFANGSTFGGGMRVAPDARPDDGLLDLVVVAALGKVELLRVFPKVYRGTHLHHPAITLARLSAARVLADRPLVPWGDGEPLGAAEAELRFEVVPGALRVVAQADTSSKRALDR